MSHWDPNFGAPQGDKYEPSQQNHYVDVEPRQFNNNTQGMAKDRRQMIDVRNSNLQATASEFRPGTSYSQGAVRRKQPVKPAPNHPRFGAKQEHDKALKETAEVLNKIKTGRPKQNNTGRNGYYNNQYRGDWKRRNDKRSDNWRQYNRWEDGDKNMAKIEKDGEEKVERFKVSKPQQLKKKLDAASQRERLEQMVAHRLLECLVCCEKLRHTDKIWSCKQCYHILHLCCIIRWAKASKLESGWRCPACQNVCHEVPVDYKCYCDKYNDPPLEVGTLPHSCGEMCGRKGRSCDHTCTLLCHPGPCPDCTVMVARSCGCGSTNPSMKCSSDLQITCQNGCHKLLNCGVHTCEKICHVDACEDCNASVKQECFCGKVGRKVKCTKEVQGIVNYECGEPCDKLLLCGNHKCEALCHPGDCAKCKTHPDEVKTCPCGQSKLGIQRNTCLDPIPCCDKVCNKKLKCGQPSDPHRCKIECHVGDCPPCSQSTLVRCRCGHMDKELACRELKSKADDARCQKKCTKKRSCCKHKCNQYCCIDFEHDCPLPCNHMLSCGLHKCEQTCHRGRCIPCWRTSFEELFCECGTSVLYPPVACGTRPPPCNKPCSRRRQCGHPPHHNCHTGACPPCIIFTTRLCHGKHESRQTIPCYQDDFSCGLPCNREMPCGRHKCTQTCHSGACPNPCVQPCNTVRPNCEHSCGQPCHEPPCPNVPCRQTVTVTCLCGLRSSTRVCVDLASDYQRIAMSQLASKMLDIQRGQSLDIGEIINKQKRIGSYKTLECNDECRLVERNRRLAIGLQIRNPDLSSKLTPRYSDYMRNWAKKDPRFCQNVHDKLTELVQLAKQSKQKSRSHSFECMNREKRHFVHEYCEHFGCDSAAYDKEPNRNIVATATRDKSWLPSVSLIELIQRESGQRKVPGPVLNKSDSGKLNVRTNESVSLKLQSRNLPRPATPPTEFVDYFDNPP